MAQPSWEFVISSLTGVVTGVLNVATDRSVTYQLNGATVLECSIPLTSTQAELIIPGITRIKGYRSAAGTVAKTLRFHGTVWAVEQQASDSGVSMMRIVAVDPFGTTLQSRYTSSNLGTGDQGTLLKSMLDTANGVSDTFVRTNSANVTASTSRSIDWSLAQKSLSEALSELASILDGTDFELRPIDAGAKMSDLYIYGGKRGSVRDEVIFGFGETTVANTTAVNAQWEMDSRLATVVRGNGQGGAYFEWQNATKLSAFGRYDRITDYSDVMDSTLLSGLAYQELIRSYDPEPQISFTAGIRAPRMFDAWQVGDTVRVHAEHGAMSVNIRARIIGATVTIDDNGVESVTGIVTQGQESDIGGNTSASVS